MATHVPKQSGDSISPAEVTETLVRILSSKHFVNAQKKKQFLRLICDFYLSGRASEINEYVLGYDVFGRDSNYNPASDPIVRVVAHDVRKKLDIYYQTDGAHDPIRLEIPSGSYQPIFIRHISPPKPEPKPAPTEAIRPAALEHATPIVPAAVAPIAPIVEVALLRAWRFNTMALGGAIVVLVIALVVLGLSNRDLRREVAQANAVKDPQAYGQLWAPYLIDSATPLVVLSNPPVLRFSNASDPRLLTETSIKLTAEQVAVLKDKSVLNPEVVVRKSTGPFAGTGEQNKADEVRNNQLPSLILSTSFFTGMGEAIGLHYLTDFFRMHGKGVLLKQSRTLSAEDVKSHNVIVLGGVWVNEWAAKLSDKEDFVYTVTGTIKNLNPWTGEEQEYIPHFDGKTGNLLIDYALITVRPNLSAENKVIELAGIYSEGTEAAAEFVTNKSYVDQLNQRLQQARTSRGVPTYFQALLKVGVENGIPTTISIVTLHGIN